MATTNQQHRHPLYAFHAAAHALIIRPSSAIALCLMPLAHSPDVSNLILPLPPSRSATTAATSTPE